MNKLKFAATIATSVLAAFATSTLHAQTYPAKTIRFVIPFPPGGSNDIVGRVMASALTERLGRTVVADNRAGGNSIIGTELFKHMTGTNMIHVPYKGGGPALIDTISGQAQICLSSLIQAVAHIRSNKLRALGTSGAVRTAILPDVPTIAEAGVPGYETQNWWGIAVARGTLPAIIQRLNSEIGAVLKTPETEKRLRGEGAEPVLKSPDELGKYVAGEMDKWVKLAKIAGIKGE